MSARRRRRSRAPEDDRPRGYEPRRMQRLWQDIDRARDSLGLGAAGETNGTSWLGWAEEALGWIPGGSACVTLTGGALRLARKLPIVGSLVDMLPSSLTEDAARPSKSGDDA